MAVTSSDFLFEPLLDIRRLEPPVLDPRLRGDDGGERGDDDQRRRDDKGCHDGIIITSIHALSAFPDHLLHMPVYCVGESVRAAFAEKGVRTIIVQPTATDLAEEIIEKNPREQLHFLYLRGKHIAFDMKGTLQQHGPYNRGNHNL